MPSLGRRTSTGDLADVEAEGSCAAVDKVVNAEIVGDTLIGDEEVDDENPLAAITDEAPTVGDDTAAVGTDAPPSKSIAASPHVCSATASSDINLKIPLGVLASSPERFASCIWQGPLMHSGYWND